MLDSEGPLQYVEQVVAATKVVRRPLAGAKTALTRSLVQPCTQSIFTAAPASLTMSLTVRPEAAITNPRQVREINPKLIN